MYFSFVRCYPLDIVRLFDSSSIVNNYIGYILCFRSGRTLFFLLVRQCDAYMSKLKSQNAYKLLIDRRHSCWIHWFFHPLSLVVVVNVVATQQHWVVVAALFDDTEQMDSTTFIFWLYCYIYFDVFSVFIFSFKIIYLLPSTHNIRTTTTHKHKQTILLWF